VTDNRKRALFLNFCGPKIFETARALLTPLTIQSVGQAMDSLCYAFHYWNQAEGESSNKYIAALRKAALYYELRHLYDALLDRVVCGVRDVKLLAKTDLTLQMALDEAQAAEMSNQSMAEIQKSNSPPASWKLVTVHHQELTLVNQQMRTMTSIASNPPRGGMWLQKRGNQHVLVMVAIIHAWHVSSRMPSVKDVKRKDIWSGSVAQTDSYHCEPRNLPQKNAENTTESWRGLLHDLQKHLQGRSSHNQASLSSCKKVHVIILIERSLAAWRWIWELQ
ncbi:hypothetical protein E2320_002340, partial [Naja naja]